jgi:DNA-binding response OmpR family regulator
MLSLLLENQDRAVSRKEILEKIWNKHSVVNIRATDDVIKRLRKKLDIAQSQVTIDTVWGYGFRFGGLS